MCFYWVFTVFAGQVAIILFRGQHNLGNGLLHSAVTMCFYCFHFSGLQRYDHFAVLAELLPVAIPSLAIFIFLREHHNLGNWLLL